MCLVAALAACHIQRITLENQQLREELEAATGGARGAGDPGHAAPRIAAQGSIESLKDAFAAASEHGATGWPVPVLPIGFTRTVCTRVPGRPHTENSRITVLRNTALPPIVNSASRVSSRYGNTWLVCT